jgi:Photosynthesis affected mutant 68
MLTFVASYFIVTQGGIKLPTSAVLLVSLGFFGLGVLGLSYGILSTSWDEEQVGSWLGTEQFGLNLGRMRGAWQEARNQAKN